MTRPRKGTPIDTDMKFAQVPEWVLFHPDLTDKAIRLYCVLARFSEGRAYPGRKLLAERLGGVSLKTVDRAIEALEHARAITVQERYDDHGDRTSNAYTVHFTPPEGVASRVTPPLDTDVPTGGDTSDATGGVTDVAGERATLSNSPQPPASGGQPALSIVCTKPGLTPHSNCRGCRTTPRLQAEDAKRAATERKRLEDQEYFDQRRAAKPPPPSPDAIARARAQIRPRSTP